ncbi:MAG: nickel-dependent lactate racemase [Desulfobacterales bacterium]|jgi:nickel-dependent lactate racemase
MQIDLPYGSETIGVRLPDHSEVLTLEECSAVSDLRTEIRRALDNPIGCAPIRELARGRSDAVIIINDTTRPTPSDLMLEALLADLAKAGIRETDVTVIIACGNHRPNTREEIRRMVGDDLASRLEIINHDCNDTENLVAADTTDTGIPVWVNAIVARAAFKIATGLIAPHHTAGYSGGRKSIIPGVAGLETLKRHHSFPVRPYEPAFGKLKGNPFHEEAVVIARRIGVDFILNVVQSGSGTISMVVAGELEAAHEHGVSFCETSWDLKVPQRYDTVIVTPGGYPRDIDLHQSQKAMSSAEMVIEKGGVIVLIAECRDGVGKYAQWLKQAQAPEEVIERFKKEGFTADHSSKAFMCARALARHEVVIACSGISEKELAQMFFTPAASPQAAIDTALDRIGPDARVLVLPNAVNCVPRVAA